jgi:hypothetical protein
MMRVDEKSPFAKCRPIVFAVSLVLVGMLSAANAQGDRMRMDGRVQWIAAEKMMLLAGPGGSPIHIDLTQVPLDQYVTLTQGTRVVVGGVLSGDGRRVIATSIVPAAGGEERP